MKILLPLKIYVQIYTAAGVDYIDVAAEESIVHAAKKGIDWAKKNFKNSPGLMLSLIHI